MKSSFLLFIQSYRLPFIFRFNELIEIVRGLSHFYGNQIARTDRTAANVDAEHVRNIVVDDDWFIQQVSSN